MSDQNDRDVCMFVQVERSQYGGDTLHVTATPCWREYESGEWRPRWFLGAGSIVRATQEGALADLRVTAQGDIFPRSGVGDDVYAWKVEYKDVFSVDVRRAEIMVKTLRRIDRGLERLERQLGRPESFPAYVARVGSILGAESFGFVSLHDTTDYKWSDATSIVWEVETRIRKIREAAGVAV